MPIPPMDKRGLLPPGIYEASVSEIEIGFATTPYRQALFRDFLAFLGQEIKVPNANLCIAGSFLSDKEFPNDIEITLVVDLPMMKSEHMPLISALINEHDRIKSQYRIDFYITIELHGYNDFREFFQYVGAKTAQDKGIDAKAKRGIIRVIL